MEFISFCRVLVLRCWYGTTTKEKYFVWSIRRLPRSEMVIRNQESLPRNDFFLLLTFAKQTKNKKEWQHCRLLPQSQRNPAMSMTGALKRNSCCSNTIRKLLGIRVRWCSTSTILQPTKFMCDDLFGWRPYRGQMSYKVWSRICTKPNSVIFTNDRINT